MATQDPTIDNIDVNKSYLICYEVNGTYYLLKNDGTTDSSHTPAQFDSLNSKYCWTFNYVFEEKHLEDTLTYVYYLIRPIDNKSKTLALFATGQPLVQKSNNNVAVVPAEGGGYKLIGYNDVKLDFDNGKFLASTDEGVTVHIYEMANLPTYSYTAEVADENAKAESRGTVSIEGGSPKTKPDPDHPDEVIHYYEAESSSNKKNAGVITATPTVHQDSEGHNKWVFDHWTQDGTVLDRDVYPETIAVDTLPIPFNGSKLVAYFKQNAEYNVPDSEKEPSSIENLSDWLNNLQNTPVPLDQNATSKSAEVYDYENRIYRVDIESKSNFRTFKGKVDMAFCMDVSNSMKFPSALDPVENNIHQNPLPIYQINDSDWTKSWLSQSRTYNNPYYLIADQAGTATVFRVYYQNGSWKAQDASKSPETKDSFIIGQNFKTNWTAEQYDRPYNANKNHPFNMGDNDNSTYTIYNAGDNGNNRFYYLKSAINTATTELSTIKNLLQVAGQASPQINIAYNTFNANLGENIRHDFEPVHSLDLSLEADANGGTRPDQAFNDANDNFSWSGDDRYVVLVTDGAPQGKRTNDETSQEIIIQKVIEAAEALKTDRSVKMITIGLSLDKVPLGKKLLYDLADTDKDGNKMFFMAESASDLPNIFRQVTKTVMDDAIIIGDVTDEVGEAFYPVDKDTGLPLQPNDMIDIEGRRVTDIDQAAGIVQPDGRTIKWTDQAIDSKVGWHGTVFVKAKEDLLGGNAMKTNGTANITATKYRIDENIREFEGSSIEHLLQSREINLNSPRVNINELTFPEQSSEWTVYLGENVDPKAQLKAMYENMEIEEVVNTDGSLHYPLAPNSISDNREEATTGTAQTLKLAPLILELIKANPELATKYVENDELKWDAFQRIQPYRRIRPFSLSA